MITLKFDIWQLGSILNELLNIGNIQKPSNNVVFSKQILKLRDDMMKKEPHERLSINEVIKSLESIESLPIPQPIPNAIPIPNPIIKPNPNPNNSKGKPTTTNYIINGAIENANTPPKRSEVEKLIQKAWLKPNKIYRFYQILKEKDIFSNTVIALKACTVIQHYIYRGPSDVVQPNQYNDLPLTLVTEFHKKWAKIEETKEINKAVILILIN